MKKVWADKSLGILPEDKFIKPSDWSGGCDDLRGMDGGYGDEGGLQTLDQIKNPRPKEEKQKAKPKEENLNDKLNKDEVNFNQ